MAPVIARLLLEQGAKVDAKAKLGRTALLMASAYAGNTDIVKALLDAGADVDYADGRGWTSVVLAARTGDSDLVRLLLDSGGNVNGGDSKKLSPGTPLMQAAWTCDVGLTEILLARGAESDKRSVNTALIFAATHGSLEMVELLLAAGADPQANVITNYVPESPILAAAYSDSLNAEYSPVTATSVSLRALQHYAPPGLEADSSDRVARATQWLIDAQATANCEKAFRLLGLHWGRADATEISNARIDLLKDQARSGGWSQLPTLQCDAYATGLTLYALGQAGLPVSDPAYRKGVEYLLETAGDDGSWHVLSRSFAFQPYFESGFPHGHDQWISAAATGWATMALLQTIEPMTNKKSEP